MEAGPNALGCRVYASYMGGHRKEYAALKPRACTTRAGLTLCVGLGTLGFRVQGLGLRDIGLPALGLQVRVKTAKLAHAPASMLLDSTRSQTFGPKSMRCLFRSSGTP